MVTVPLPNPPLVELSVPTWRVPAFTVVEPVLERFAAVTTTVPRPKPLVKLPPPDKVPFRINVELAGASTVSATENPALWLIFALYEAMPVAELLRVDPPELIVIGRLAKGENPRKSNVAPDCKVRLPTVVEGPRAPA